MVRWAQSLFALAKQGRRFALACLLVKLEVGVQDAWVRDDMTKAEADDLIAQIVAGAEAVEISIGLLEQRLADALSINVARDVPPPFGLLQVAETLALGPLHPESISPPALVEALIGDLPPGRKDTKAVLAAHRASARWEAGVRNGHLLVRGGRGRGRASSTATDAQTADRGGLGPAPSRKTVILGPDCGLKRRTNCHDQRRQD